MLFTLNPSPTEVISLRDDSHPSSLAAVSGRGAKVGLGCVLPSFHAAQPTYLAAVEASGWGLACSRCLVMMDRPRPPERERAPRVCPSMSASSHSLHVADTLRASREPVLLRALRDAQRLPPGAQDWWEGQSCPSDGGMKCKGGTNPSNWGIQSGLHGGDNRWAGTLKRSGTLIVGCWLLRLTPLGKLHPCR